MRKIFLYIFFSSMISFAYSQIRQGPPQPGIEVRLFNTMKTLSEEQKNQITSELDNIKRSRELFRGTLSKKQLDILKNNTLSSLRKREMLIKTFTPSQRDILNKADVRVKNLIHTVKSNFSDKQRKELNDLRRKYSKIRQGDPRGSRLKAGEMERRKKRPLPKNNRGNR